MRKLIAGMRMSVDEKIEGPEGYADWVESWADGYGLMPQVDACLLGAGMYPGYEQYWSAMQAAPEQPLPMTGKLPTSEELEWARFAARTPHYVLSGKRPAAQWPLTRNLTGTDDVAALKRQPGKDIYLVGGARTTASLIDAGLVDELRLIVYPLIAGSGKALFSGLQARRGLRLRKVEQLQGERLSLTYAVA